MLDVAIVVEEPSGDETIVVWLADNDVIVD